jgi:hypothetical protein
VIFCHKDQACKITLLDVLMDKGCICVLALEMMLSCGCLIALVGGHSFLL